MVFPVFKQTTVLSAPMYDLGAAGKGSSEPAHPICVHNLKHAEESCKQQAALINHSDEQQRWMVVKVATEDDS
jgi:hypothetical protein